jgi:hypothetical protein
VWINYSHWIKYTTLYLAVGVFSLHLLKKSSLFLCQSILFCGTNSDIFQQFADSKKYENERKKTILIADVESGCPIWDSW